jgi:hypothetical protein
MAQTANFDWEQGEDLLIKLIYKEGATGAEAVVDLSSGYQLRMDIVTPSPNRERIYTINSAVIADVDPVLPGAQPDNVLEAILSSGAGGTANITITVPRALALPGGPVYSKMTATPPLFIFKYDMFLRNVSQSKILTGTINVKESNTLWV